MKKWLVISVIAILAIVGVGYILYQFTTSGPERISEIKATPSPSTNESTKKKSFSSKEECQEKTKRGCQCMITKLDTARSNPECVGWQPITY